MNLKNQRIIHKVFGEGVITQHDEKYLTVSFDVGEKKFIFPDAFDGFLVAKDTDIAEKIISLLEEIKDNKLRIQQENERKKELERQKEMSNVGLNTKRLVTKVYPRANIAFKCIFCDGGQSDYQIGFNGVCSDKLIYNNIEIERRTWCNSDDCPCLQYHNKEISRKELDAMCEEAGFVCYESQMLRDWKALAGIIQNGENKGKPMKLNQVQANSLCALTTRDPQSTEENRYIFAVFLVDETYEGDGHEEGYVSTKSQYKIKLSPAEARSLLFWNYYANDSNPESPAWGSGLHRYFEDEQAAQILRDVAQIKIGTTDEKLALDFYKHFCKINGVDDSILGESCGALRLKRR